MRRCAGWWEIVFSTFAWDTGEYRFQASGRSPDPDVALSLRRRPSSSKESDGCPKTGSPFRDRMGEATGPILATDHVALPVSAADAPGGVPLSRIDGILDVDSLLKIAGASRLSTAKILYALVSCGIVEWKQEGPSVRLADAAASTGSTSKSPRSPTDRSPGHAELVRNTYRRIDWLRTTSCWACRATRPEKSRRPTSSAAVSSTRSATPR
jgi:hypothetical protein